MSNLSRPVSGILTLLSAAIFWSQPGLASCGGSFCSVNTQWETQGAWTGTGIRLNLHYAYIDQDQLRRGRNKVAAEGTAGTTDEVRTLNRYLIADVDYALDPDWSISIQLPLIQRNHRHRYNDVLPVNESWSIHDLGDLRVLGHRQFALSDDTSAGLRFGLKLPSGKIDATNDGGTPAERSLQAGSGSTDAILSGYYYRKLEGNATTAFAQGQWQRPVTERDGYEPGQQVSVDMGLRYAVTLATSALLQLNLLWKDHDQGVNAEPEESGGRYAYLSPGMSHGFTPRLQLYGFVQLPLYQYVTGTQITADWSAIAGVSWKF